MIWNQVVGGVATLADLYDGQAGEAAFDAFARDRLSPLLAHIGWEVHPGEPANAAILRERLIGVLSTLDDPAVIAEARRRYAAADADPSSLPAGLRNVVMRVVGAHADAATFDDLSRRAQTAASPLERSLYQTALARALDTALAQRAIDLAFDSQTRAQDAFVMVRNLMSRQPDLLWDKTMADTIRFREITPEAFQVAVLSTMAAESDRPGQIDLMRAYVAAHYPDAPLGEVEQAASRAALDHRIQHDQLPEVTSWLNSGKNIGRQP